jgi:hypothetical protein
MQFYLILYIIFFSLLGIGFLFYSVGAVRHAKAFLVALPAAIAIGFCSGWAIMLGGLLLFDLRAEWAGIALFAIALFTGTAFAGLSFIPLYILLLRLLKPSKPTAALQKASIVAAVATVILVSLLLFQVIPKTHPTSILINEATASVPEIFEPAQKELVNRGKDAIPALLEAASDDPFRENGFMLPRILGQIPGEEATAALIVLLENPNPQIRATAAMLIGARKASRARELLLEQLKDPEYDYSQRRLVLSGIVELGDPSVIPDVIKAVGRLPDDVQGSDALLYQDSLLEAMGKLRRPQAYEFLVSLHDHPQARVRVDVMEQLVNYPCRPVARILIEHLNDPERMVSSGAHDSLVKVAEAAGEPAAHSRLAEEQALDIVWSRWCEKNCDLLPEQPIFSE